MVNSNTSYPPVSDTVAAQVVGQVALRAVGVLEIHAQLVDVPGRESDLSYDEPPINVAWVRSGNRVVAVFPCELLANQTPPGGEPAPLCRIRVVHQLEYALAEGARDLTDEELRNYLGVVGMMHVWPYFRAEVQTLIVKLSLPALTLPVKVSGSAASLVRIGLPGKEPGESAGTGEQSAPKQKGKRATRPSRKKS